VLAIGVLTNISVAAAKTQCFVKPLIEKRGSLLLSEAASYYSGIRKANDGLKEILQICRKEPIP
jgi:hypothetical protein